MKMEKMPEVTRTNDGAFWSNSYEKFDVEVYVPHSPLQGDILNYGFIAPYLLVFAPEKSSKLDNYGKVEGKITDYSCPEEKNGLKKFVMFYEGNRKILFSLDEEMVKLLKNKCPRVFSEY